LCFLFNIGSAIQIENGSNFQIGNSFAFNFAQAKKPKNKKKSTTQRDLTSELPGMKQLLGIRILINWKSITSAVLLRSDLRVTTAKIKGVRIGEPWRFVMRHLHLTDAEIENKHEEYINKGGIEEVRMIKISWHNITLWTMCFAGDLPAFENVVWKKW
jgi:hypothetical protein